MSTTRPPSPPRPTSASGSGSMRADRTIIDAPTPATAPPTGATGPAERPSQPGIKLELTAGLRIAQYELIRELGRGGMGQVFLARDTKLGRRVAMKFLAGSSKHFTERFRAEARVTATVNHESIVTIYEVGEYPRPYMVLEYVEGVTLGKIMAERRVPVGRTAELIVPVLRALARAHEANIVHRDLKPDNIVVTDTGAVKVLDFGVAKLFVNPEDASTKRGPVSIPEGDLYKTRAGAIVGTLPYMSPRAARDGHRRSPQRRVVARDHLVRDAGGQSSARAGHPGPADRRRGRARRADAEPRQRGGRVARSASSRWSRAASRRRRTSATRAPPSCAPSSSRSCRRAPGAA